MKSNYYKLGDFIEQTEERNKDFAISLSQGICNLKYFQNPRQVAENSAADKIVRTGWFAYNRATTRNGDKISIAYRDKEDCTVSASYLTFKIKDENLLNPYYLMLWFKRPEFDRYARFKSHGSAHEYFEWEEMCDVMLPVPSIEEQRKIVAEYQAVERRIENNRRLIAKLEETAQTIYRNMFVDNIDPENVPQGWRLGSINELSTLKVGGDKPLNFSLSPDIDHNIPIFSNGIINEGLYGYTDKFSIDSPSFTISARGTIGKCFLRLHPYFSIVRLISVIPKDLNTLMYQFFFFSNLNIEGDGSVQNQLTVPFLSSEKMIIPNTTLMHLFNERVLPFFKHIEILNGENYINYNFLSLLLSKLSKLN